MRSDELFDVYGVRSGRPARRRSQGLSTRTACAVTRVTDKLQNLMPERLDLRDLTVRRRIGSVTGGGR
jgi:hypothetical protein